MLVESKDQTARKDETASKDDLRKLWKMCLDKAMNNNEYYKSFKRCDDVLEVSNSVIDGATIALLVASFTHPMLLLIGTIASSYTFIVNRAMSKFELKNRISNYQLITRQYGDIAREIATVLLHNDLTKKKIIKYIEDINRRIDLVEDNVE